MLTFLCHEKCFHRSPDRNAREINTLSGTWARFVSYRLKYFKYLCAKYFRQIKHEKDLGTISQTPFLRLRVEKQLYKQFYWLPEPSQIICLIRENEQRICFSFSLFFSSAIVRYLKNKNKNKKTVTQENRGKPRYSLSGTRKKWGENIIF